MLVQAEDIKAKAYWSRTGRLKGLKHWALDFLYPYGPEHEAWRHEDLDYLCSKGLRHEGLNIKAP
jgi:hypothetical protein